MYILYICDRFKIIIKQIFEIFSNFKIENNNVYINFLKFYLFLFNYYYLNIWI